MKKFLSIFAALILVILLGIYFFKKKSAPVATISSEEFLTNPSNTFSPQTKKDPKIEPGPPTQDVNPQFVQYLRAEAQRMNASSVDQEKVQKEIEAVVEKMTAKELEFAKNVALSTSRSANEKILAIYLILNAKNSEKTLEEFVASPLIHKPNPETHSIEETAAMQEKAGRVMAIDGLLQKAVKNPNTRDMLARIATSMSDPTLKAYLIKKLKELPPIP